MRRWLGVSALIVALDQGTKWAVVRHLADGAVVRVGPWLNLLLGYNQGAAFGFLRHAGGWQNLMFSLVAAVIIGFIVITLWQLPPQQKMLGWALALVLGGAIGNLIDRIRLGQVVDFIDFHLGSAHWYTFNVADAAISVGALLLAVDALGLGSRKGT